MSSILKALKKIEKEKPGQNAMEPPPGILRVRRSIGRKNSMALVFKTLSILLIILALSFGAFLYTRKSQKPLMAKPAVPEAAPKARPVAEPVKKNVPIPPKKKEIKRPEKRYSGPEIAKPVMPIEKKKPVKRTKAKSIKKPAKVIAPKPKMEVKKAPDKKKAPETAQVSSDPRISLQALVWSPDEKSRMVMVNSQILRPKGTIDGIEVVQIGENYVIFRDGSKKWRQNFKVQ